MGYVDGKFGITMVGGLQIGSKKEEAEYHVALAKGFIAAIGKLI